MQLTQKVHQLLREHLSPGDCAIDATAGNGHDTLFLAELVASDGQIIAMDLQEAAIESTRERLSQKQLDARVELRLGDHAELLEALAETPVRPIAAILFNLGYLPGSDKSVQTQATSTTRALDASLKLLKPSGLLCVTAYRGHPGGQEEANQVEKWMRLQETAGNPIQHFVPDSTNTPPVLWVLQKGT